jgi:hypothetical protein
MITIPIERSRTRLKLSAWRLKALLARRFPGKKRALKICKAERSRSQQKVKALIRRIELKILIAIKLINGTVIKKMLTAESSAS